MVLLAALFGLAIAVVLAFCLPTWASAGAAGVLVAVLAIGGERFLLHAVAAAVLVAYAGWLWRRHEARRALELPEAARSSSIAKPKTKAKDAKAEAARRRVA